MNDVRYLTDGKLTYREFDTIPPPSPSRDWALLQQLDQAAGREVEAGKPGRNAAAPIALASIAPNTGRLALGRYAGPTPGGGRDLPLSEIFAKLAQVAT